MSKLTDAERERLSKDLIKLGDILGDGDLEPSDEKYFKKEYKKVFGLLYPEVNRAKRKNRMIAVNKRVLRLIEKNKCSCGGEYRQSRSGSLICYCKKCNKRVKVVKKRGKQ